jgi:hypothetical protein
MLLTIHATSRIATFDELAHSVSKDFEQWTFMGKPLMDEEQQKSGWTDFLCFG